MDARLRKPLLAVACLCLAAPAGADSVDPDAGAVPVPAPSVLAPPVSAPSVPASAPSVPASAPSVPAVSARPPMPEPADALEAFLAGVRREALERGISPSTIDASLVGIVDRPQVVEADRSQPTSPNGFCHYLGKRLTPTRIARGKRMMDEHHELLAEITRDYGVPARYVVALWGLETNFGDYQGDHPIFDTLVTLARDPRRADFFREQIFAGLRMVEDGHHSAEGFVGSWAGATGQVQFMPSTYLEYAVDHDGDGVKDLWTSIPDALASAANLLARSGWRSGETWGRQVALPRELHADARSLHGKKRSLEGWSEMGVRRSSGAPLPSAKLLARLVLPQRRADAAFLVYPNYSVFMDWNRSTFFAISVGTLADEIDDRSTLNACRG